MSVQKINSPQIELSTEPWELVEADAFVCPVNCEGVFTHYPGSYLKQLSGLDLDTILRPHSPFAIGAAFVSPGGRMRVPWLIHVPNTEQPGGHVLVEDITRAIAATLVVCELKGFQSIAVPLMGAFDSGIPAEEAARAIHSEFKSHRGDRPSRVLLMARTSDEVEVFELAIEGIP